MTTIELPELFAWMKALKEKPIEGRVTKAKQIERDARNKVIDEILDHIRGMKHKEVLRIFVNEVDRELSEKDLQYTAGRVYSEYRSGLGLETEQGQIGYEQVGAQETFAIGMPMFSQEGEYIGRLGIGFYDCLPWAKRDGRDKEIPVHFWKIEGYKGKGESPLTYYQYMNKFRKNEHSGSD